MSKEAWPTDEEIDALCSPGRSGRWKNDGRQYDRDTVRLALQAFAARPPAQPDGRSAVGRPLRSPDLLERVKASIRNDLGLVATEHQAMMVIDALSRDGASLEVRDAEASLACARSPNQASFMEGVRWMVTMGGHWPAATPAAPAEEESPVYLSEGLAKDLLDHCPYAIRSATDGGPENLAKSLEMTFCRMEQILEGRENGILGGVDVTLPLRQRLFGRADQRKLSETVAEAVRKLDASGRGASAADVIRDAAEVLSAVPDFLTALESAENKEPLQPGNLRKLVRAARAYRAPVQAWMYLRDDVVYGPDNPPTVVPVHKRWPKESVVEPWNEVPLIAGG